MDKKIMDIFKIKQKSDTTEDKEPVLYTMLGKQTHLDSDGYPITTKLEDAVAKKTYTSQMNFYIKIGANGKIYNPMGMFSEGNHNKFLAKLGKNEWKFTRVNQKVFDMYINFLKTKNTAWLNNAQREIY